MDQGLPLVFGCHNVTGGSSVRRSVRLIHCALDHGIRKFDVAPSYGMGTAEAVLGQALHGRHSAIEVTTKFGIDPPRLAPLLAWAREPYRWISPILQMSRQSTAVLVEMKPKAAPAAVRLLPAPNSYLGLRSSLERSLRALRLDRVNTLLTHEALDTSRFTEHMTELKTAREDGLLTSFGVSGAGDSIAQILADFREFIEVIQVSIQDHNRFDGFRTIRCFNIVKILGPKIEDRSRRDKLYRDELSSALGDVHSVADRCALASMTAFHQLFPNSTLIATSSVEDRIADMVRYLGEPHLMRWAAANRAVHEKMVAG